MNIKPDWKEYLQEIAAATATQGGAAFHLNTCQFLPPMDAWSFPKYPGRTCILPHDIDLIAALSNFISINEPFLREPDCWLGTWVHPQTQEFYLDISTSCDDMEQAIERAQEVSDRDGRKIVALYNSQRKRTIYLE